MSTVEGGYRCLHSLDSESADWIEEVRAAIQKYMPTLEDESGTPMYVVYQGRDDPSWIVFYKQYRDQAAKNEHNKNPALKEMMDVIYPVLEGEVITGFYETLIQKE